MEIKRAAEIAQKNHSPMEFCVEIILMPQSVECENILERPLAVFVVLGPV